jgi:diguanylate cyclase (GGDEF)-like protein
MTLLFNSLKGISFPSVVETMGDAICIMDKNMDIHTANNKFAEMYGVALDEIIGKNAFEIYPDFQKSVFFDIFKKTLETGKKYAKVGYSLNTKRWIVCRTFNHEGSCLANIHELTKEEENGYMNKVDSLTSLGNRFAFEQDVESILTVGQNFGMILIDINRFHNINETLGFDVGNMLLMEVSSALHQTVTSGNRLYKIGGDQFLILSTQNREEFKVELKKIHTILEKTFNIQNKQINISTTTGYLYKDDNTIDNNSSTILKNLEAALFRAKKSKVNSLEYTPGMARKISSLEIEQDLRNAIVQDQFQLFYQPQYSFLTKKVTGAEALIRWNHPTKGFISPVDFLPLAEELNLMREIDKWVITRTLKDLNTLASHNLNTKLAINLSSDSISSLSTIEFINSSLKDAGMAHDMLAFEITESSLMHDVDISKQVIANLNVNGAQIAIDDFGTGYSSMEYLIKYPSDFLKIDREFIKDMTSSKTHRIMVANIIKMGHSLGMKIIAEGIESQHEQNLLEEMGCDIIQGYFYAKPMGFEAFEFFLKNNS